MSHKQVFDRIRKTVETGFDLLEIEDLIKEIRFLSLEIGDTRLYFGDGIESCTFTSDHKPFLIELWKSLASWVQTRDYWLKQNHSLKTENNRLLMSIKGLVPEEKLSASLNDLIQNHKKRESKQEPLSSFFEKKEEPKA